jgi:CRP-like cAMP-binding protein
MSPARQANRSPRRREIARQSPADPILQTERHATSRSVAAKKSRDFDPHAFLGTIGAGRESVLFPKKQRIFAQGDTADAVFYVQTGRVTLTVVSKTGKEATIGTLGARGFFGEACLAGQPEWAAVGARETRSREETAGLGFRGLARRNWRAQGDPLT